MQPLNPFLRALFRSTVPGQAIPIQHHVLLVPTTESLLYGCDETGREYRDLVQDEDFIGSHVLRITQPGGKEAQNVRDNRGKAKTYSTINGQTVIIKENVVYSNKGFKVLTQAQLLGDALYSSLTDNQQWLIYYISRPLVGAYEAAPLIPATIGGNIPKSTEETATSAPPVPKKKDIKTFGELLNNFPMIARQMQPGLERLINEFGKELGKPLPPPPSRLSTTSSSDDLTRIGSENGSVYSNRSNGSVKLPFLTALDDGEAVMRRALENAVTGAIDLFQLVDKQQLSFLGATTDLTGPAVERLIERYVAEQVHDGLLFPRLRSYYKLQDLELDKRIRQMENIDVSQVGIAIEDGRRGKQELLRRVTNGVTAFRKLGVASGPHEMLDILLETQKAVTDTPESAPGDSTRKEIDSEKRPSTITINADVLVSLLLLVVVRSQIRHLQARLSYMQRFIFVDDVESGELGYALSTLEAVLTYLARDSGGLRKASRQNEKLWDAVKGGRTSAIREILEDAALPGEREGVDFPLQNEGIDIPVVDYHHDMDPTFPLASPAAETNMDTKTNLAHVFPFQASPQHDSDLVQPRRGKRVTMDIRSHSVSSAVSLRSRATTIDSTFSGIEGDTSVGSLAQTQDPSGNSVLMMAIEARQVESLKYLLELNEHYSTELVLDDTTSEGTTLLSAAIQLGHKEAIDAILEYISKLDNEEVYRSYLSKADKRGRTAAHYLFNAPELMSKIGQKIFWRQRDKNGQTPLYALCRSYDHAEYANMVSEALVLAREAQEDGLQLHLEDHTDNKGNTILHIVNDSNVTHRILVDCDVDPNAVNDKKFTPLMLASKYGRLDMVRVFFGDPRVDLNLKEARGLTAVELAKDDEVRNRIDDLTLFSGSPLPANDPIGATIVHADPHESAGRITTIVRSFFVEDGSIRFILKSGAPSRNDGASNMTYTITTSRRTLQDFENLAKWLALDHPASYLPSLALMNFRSPFQIHSRPSRAVLHATQGTLDRFLKILLSHPTFSTHEMLWEFFLVPDMQSDQMAERAKLKGQLLAENISEDYEPETNIAQSELLTRHSREMVRSINTATRNAIKRGHNLQQAVVDMADALAIATSALATLGPIPHLAKKVDPDTPASVGSSTLTKLHVTALRRYAALMHTAEPSPLETLVHAITSFQSTNIAIQTALIRPSTLANRIVEAQRSLTRSRQHLNTQSLPRKFNFPVPGLEENRIKSMQETERKIMQGEQDVDRLGRELRYTQEVVVGELAGWTAWRERSGKETIKAFVKATVVKEQERYKGMQRCLKALRDGIGKQ